MMICFFSEQSYHNNQMTQKDRIPVPLLIEVNEMNILEN